jgi:hypothetical protein
MTVSAAPFAGHASGGPPAAAHARDAELTGGEHTVRNVRFIALVSDGFR